jgi:hypothetical protein
MNSDFNLYARLPAFDCVMGCFSEFLLSASHSVMPLLKSHLGLLDTIFCVHDVRIQYHA